MNDYELIYLFKSYYDEESFTFMHLKYRHFMYKIIHTLHINPNDLDDFYQERHLMLLKAIITFNESYQKSFTRYFELILRRHLYHLLNSTPKYILKDEVFMEDVKSPDAFVLEEDTFVFDNSKEHLIYELYYVKSLKVKEIAIQTNLSSKQVYNLIYRVKNKIMYMVKKSNQS